jgi:hypothetical protein
VVPVDRAEFESHVVERTALTGHEGKSGAALERATMDDGRKLVVKSLSPASDMVMALTGDEVGREYLLWSGGVLDRLPEGVGHAVVGGWVEDDGTVLVMRDLADSVLTWADRLDAERCRWVLERVASLHEAFVGSEALPEGAATPLPDVLGLFTPNRLAAHAGGSNELAAIALHGWEVFFDVVPRDVAEGVAEIHDDVGPLVSALDRCPCTLIHGDLATVNLALEPDTLTLLDWSMPALAPGAVDIARFIAGCSSVVDLSREEIIASYRAACVSSYDERAMRLALLTGLVWLGWNKAMDSVEHPDPATRAREGEDLAWWVDRARVALEAGLA